MDRIKAALARLESVFKRWFDHTDPETQVRAAQTEMNQAVHDHMESLTADVEKLKESTQALAAHASAMHAFAEGNADLPDHPAIPLVAPAKVANVVQPTEGEIKAVLDRGDAVAKDIEEKAHKE